MRTGEDRAVVLDRHIVAGRLTDPLPSRSDLRTGFLIEMNPVVGCVLGAVRFGGHDDNRLVDPEHPDASRIAVCGRFERACVHCPSLLCWQGECDPKGARVRSGVARPITDDAGCSEEDTSELQSLMRSSYAVF